MKITIPKPRGEAGNLILVALIIGGIAGITLGSYLLMTQQQSTSIYRSQTWNSTMAVTEAGVEDGLQLVNWYAGSFVASDILKWTNNAHGAGWDNDCGANIYHVRRYITNVVSSGTVTHYYDAWITNLNNEPIVYAEGTVPWTYLYAQNPALQPIFAQAGGSITPRGNQPSSITRRIFVKTHYDPLFVVAMAAIGNIDLRGNNVATDSFDSSDPLYSNNGQYPLGNPNRTRAHGDVCTDAAIIDSLSVGNADIKGNVRTGPGTNTISIGPNGSVGDRAWVEGGNSGIQPNHSTTDFNVLFPTVKDPTGVAVPVVPTSLNGTNFLNLTSGYWQIGSFNGPTVIVAPSNAVVNIKVTGNVNLTGNNDYIAIAPTGAKVNMFMYGSSFSMSGNAQINNQSGLADNFTLFGMPSCSSINFGGNAGFCGGVYAPQASFSLGGGGNNTYDFIGSSVTKTVSINGHFNFHFDENLAKTGPARGYIPVAWREL